MVAPRSLTSAFGRGLVVLLAGVTLLSTTPTTPSGATTAHCITPALMSVGAWNAGSTYRLTTPNSCTVGDGNLAFTNPSAVPIQITGIDLLTKADATMTVATTLIAERPDATTGEVAASSTISVLAGGRVLGTAIRPDVAARTLSELSERVPRAVETAAAQTQDLPGAIPEIVASQFKNLQP